MPLTHDTLISFLKALDGTMSCACKCPDGRRHESPLLAAIVAARRPPRGRKPGFPQQGEATASIVVTDVLVREHYLPTEALDRGHIRLDDHDRRRDVRPSRRSRPQRGPPIVRSRYWGAFPHAGGLDDGMDIRLFRSEVACATVSRGALMVTAFCRLASFPATDTSTLHTRQQAGGGAAS